MSVVCHFVRKRKCNFAPPPLFFDLRKKNFGVKVINCQRGFAIVSPPAPISQATNALKS